MLVEISGSADFKSMPWANGRGTTLELLRQEKDGHMLWRLSAADVVEDGDFSPWPGVDRTLILLEGAGFDLDFGDQGRANHVEAFVPVVFSGDWKTRAVNVRGRSQDFNIMARRDAVATDVRVVDGPCTGRSESELAIFVARGMFTAKIGGEVHLLRAGQLLHAQGQGGYDLRGSGKAIVIGVQPR